MGVKDAPIQNIPIRTELGRKLREAFLPLVKVDIDVDYASIEKSILEKTNERRRDQARDAT